MLGLVRWSIEDQHRLIEQESSRGIEINVRKNHYHLEQLDGLEKILLEKGAIDRGWDWDAENKLHEN